MSAVLSLKSVTGLHMPGAETQILGAGREKTGGGGRISPGVRALRRYLTDHSICQHCLIHMSNNIFSLFPGHVLFVFLSRRIRSHRCVSPQKDWRGHERGKHGRLAGLPTFHFILSKFLNIVMAELSSVIGSRTRSRN